MPYLKPERRAGLDRELDLPQCKGDLNYTHYQESLAYLRRKGLSYDNISDVIAALNDCAEELRRQIMNPYEDKKIAENGGLPL